MTENERRLIEDSLAYVHTPTTDNYQMWLEACQRVIADRKVVPPGEVLIIRHRPDGPILPEIDRRTGKLITHG